MNPDTVKVRLEPLAVEVDVPRGAPLISSLSDRGIEFPCGGTGLCGGCGVRVLTGSLAITNADRTSFTSEELAQGWRLACQAHTAAALVLVCGQWHMDVLADPSSQAPAGIPVVADPSAVAERRGLGIAIDLGTTTIAAQIVDLASGNVLGIETGLNPQARFGSDVMSRIRAALAGEDLTTAVRASLGGTVSHLAHGREDQVAEVILVGNTVMHHLFSGRSVEPLAAVPFISPHLGTESFQPGELGWQLPAESTVRFAHCLGGFVGSDILAGIIATGMASSDDLIALVDLGTNGEIAIGNRNRIVCASTAAGPAFEAGAIRMGTRAATGAISYVTLAGSELRVTVIGDVEPRGICGSGLVDAVAAGLLSGAILPSGRIAGPSKIFPIAGPVVLCQADIRELQLAKAAIAAGFKLLLNRLGAQVSDLKSIHLAGAFGNYVQIESAIRIGLMDAPRELVHAAGNTALRGAKMLLATGEPILPIIEHVSLAADPSFQDEFANSMTFAGPSTA
jgi:uncharacterized 2Fe-2S/4Fe-4S cluster protein (DUF4445 family)